MIENLIYQALQGINGLSGLLAKYSDTPAIFYQQAPNDQDDGWDGLQTPRVDYMVDWQYNAERKAEGALEVNVWCSSTQEITPEEIEPLIRVGLSELFLTDETETYAIVWARSDPFGVEGNEPIMLGITLQFDILAFPVQYTTTPDPVEGVNLCLKQFMPNAKIIGVDTLPALCRASAEEPIIYCRLQTDESSMKNSYAVAWITTNIAIHVFADHPQARQTRCREITNILALEGEIILTDDSPMILKQLKINTSYNPLQQGQITISGQYGVLRKEDPAPIMENINLSRKAGAF